MRQKISINTQPLVFSDFCTTLYSWNWFIRIKCVSWPWTVSNVFSDSC